MRHPHVIGIDDGPFARDHRGDVRVVGVVTRGAFDVDGVLTTRVRRDGQNATDKLVKMAGESRFAPALRAILIDGLTLAGFNVVDLPQLAARTGRPCLAVTRRRPDLEAVRRALARLPGGDRKLALVRRAGRLHRFRSITFQVAGASPERARELLAQLVGRSALPEPIRLAHLIASGVDRGSSRGRP